MGMMKKDLFCKLLYASGILKLIQIFNNFTQKRVTIVMFHRVGKYRPGEASGLPTLFVQPESFKKIVDVIRKRYNVISMSEYCRRISSGEPFSRNSLIITFDDGYRDSFRNAFPLLHQHKLPFLLYIPSVILNGGINYWWDRVYNLCILFPPKQLLTALATCHLNNDIEATLINVISGFQDNRHNMALRFVEAMCELPTPTRKNVISHLERIYTADKSRKLPESDIMGFSDVQMLADMGGEIGSHTITHCFLDNAPEKLVWEEVASSKKEIENKLNTEVLSFAYPAGRVMPEIRDKVEKAHYLNACTIEEGINDRQQDPYLLNRVNISEELVVDRNGEFSKAIFLTRLIFSGYLARFPKLKEKLASWFAYHLLG